jgi:hypothetical protein
MGHKLGHKLGQNLGHKLDKAELRELLDRVSKQLKAEGPNGRG